VNVLENVGTESLRGGWFLPQHAWPGQSTRWSYMKQTFLPKIV
jgi:hypothetical protein